MFGLFLPPLSSTQPEKDVKLNHGRKRNLAVVEALLSAAPSKGRFKIRPCPLSRTLVFFLRRKYILR